VDRRDAHAGQAVGWRSDTAFCNRLQFAPQKNAEIAVCSDESLIYQSNNDAAQRYKRLH
jgi:hypothetical protein